MKQGLKILFIIGRFFSPFYSALMSVRAFLYRRGFLLHSEKLPVPVLSVGNLTMGGTGKTPLVLYLTRHLLGEDRKPAIVSRGYGGRASKPVNVVSDGQRIKLKAAIAGDEPSLLAEALPGVPVLTGPKRAKVGRFAIKKFKIDTIVLDDGFQHLGIARDLDLVLFSARTFLGSGWVFPGGELRESFSALKRADAFIITGIDHNNIEKASSFKKFLRNYFPQIPVFMGEYLPVCLMHSQRTKTFAIEKAKRQLLYAFAGIAYPESFKETLEKENFKLVGFQAFKDHHDYTFEDIDGLIEEARQRKAQALITTEKDFVKLKPYFGDFPILALKVELFMEEEFDLFLNDRIRKL